MTYFREIPSGIGAAAPRFFGDAARPGQSAARRCATRFTRARNFRELIALVRAAEAKLASCGFTSVGQRIHVLRGVYYGTEWSNDYRVERSPVRNLGFQAYTASTTPPDPRPCLDCGLFEALGQSQDVRDGARSVDFGHLMIGLDARQSAIARVAPIPSQGGTGLAISTWLGDLGGGAAMLSVRRAGVPATRAVTVFQGTDFGGSINLEGDAAAYLVARDPSVVNQPSPLHFNHGRTLADALNAYLGASGPTPEWNSRGRVFMQMLGARFDPAGSLTNRAGLIDSLARQISGFGCWYLINRLRQQGRLNPPLLRAAAGFLPGASHEVAQVFVDALDHSRRRPGDAIAARGPGPAPTPAVAPGGTCGAAISALTTAQGVVERGQRVLRQGERLYEQGRDWLRRQGI
jgi:hypothetical protein